MLNSKQRAKLRGIASTVTPTSIIGKDGLSENILDQIDKQLTAREIVKVNVLENADFSAKEYLGIAAQELKAEEVCSIGRKFVLYRRSNKKGINHIEID